MFVYFEKNFQFLLNGPNIKMNCMSALTDRSEVRSTHGLHMVYTDTHPPTLL